MLSDGEMSYLYDGFGRLEQVTKADGSFQKNHYNAEGLRAEMEENGQLVKFLYNENREAVAEEESDGNVIRYIRRLGLISSDSEKAKTYYHYVSDEQGSITHVINGEEKESGELPQEDVQSRVLNHYEYDAFGNTVSCEEQVHNRFRYTGEQYDPLTGQYYLRARYYNPVIARFTQEDTYYGDGLNLYTYCQNNPILNHDPTGHGTKENSPYSRKEQQYIDAGADPDTARLAAECYPDAKSKQDLYNKYKKQGYSAQDAKKLANREIIHGEEATKKYIKDNNVKKSGPDYTATSPRDNVNTDWRTQERLNAQRNAGAGKGNESGNKSGNSSIHYGELDSLGRATGVDATITVDMVGTGTPAKSSIKPAGFGGQKAGHARGHLLGDQLGGAGDDPRNLTTLFQNPVNHPVMSSVEGSVRKAVEAGEVVQYSVKPIYEGNTLIPSGVTIKAEGDKGFYIYQTILNRK